MLVFSDTGRSMGLVVDEIATAEVVTTAVGPTILRFVAYRTIVFGAAAEDPKA